MPNLQWVRGAIDTEQVAVPLGKSGEVSVYNATGKTDVLVDVVGYDQPSSAGNAGLFVPLAPYRVCDTRPGNPSGLTGGDANCEDQTLGSGGTLGYIPVLGTTPSGTSADGVPLTGVSAVVLNVTVLDATAAGELTIWPSAVAQPAAWNVAWTAGATVSKRIVLDLQGANDLEAYNSAGSTDITVDIDGYYTSGSVRTAGSYFTPLSASTICDTAPGNPHSLTGKAAQCNGTKDAGETLKAHGVLTIAVAGVGGVGVEDSAAPPTAALLEIGADDTTAASSLSVYGTKSAQPAVADESWGASGVKTENIVFAGLGSGGDVNLYNVAGRADVVVQVLGYESGGIFLPASTLPLTTSTMSSLTQMTGTSKGVVTLTFKGKPSQISSLVPGDVINSAATKQAPYGILEKVTSVTHSGGNTAVAAVTPPLSEVLTEGSLAYASAAKDYAPKLNEAGPSLHTGARRSGRADGAGGTFSCGGNAGGNVNANITDFSLTPNVDFSWSPLANFSADVSMRLDLGYTNSMSLNGSFNCNRSFPLIKTTAIGPEAPIDIGPIAFTLTPVAGVSFVLAATGTASDTTSKTTTAFYESAGLHYDTSNGFSVHHSSGCDSPVPNGTPGCTESSSTPSYNVALTLSAGLNFQVAMAVDYVPVVNNVVGPYLSVIPAVQLKLQPSAPTVQLNLNLQVQIGLTFQVWVLNLKVYFDLLNDTWTLYHSIYQTSPGNLPSAVATSPYSETLTADGGSTPYTWSLPPDSGAPPWLSLNGGGTLSGTPPLNASGTSASFKVAVTDDSGATALETYGLSVGPPVSLLTKSLSDAIINQQYYAQILAVGGTQPYTFSATQLPTWLTLDSSYGYLSGTVPTTAGGQTYKFTVKVTDSTKPATSASVTLSLYVEPFGIAVTSLPEAAVSFPYSTSLYAQNGTAPYTWSVDSKTPLPSWLSLSAGEGTLEGTPPASARGTTVHFTIDVTDSSKPALKASAPFSLLVSPWVESEVTTPDGHSYQLNDVSCWSDSGCIAVGTDDNASTGTVSLLAGRYDGSGWSFSDVRAPAEASEPVLSGVSCISQTFCMAVGSYRLLCAGTQSPSSQPLALRWNGAWSILAKPPEPCSEGAALASVSCVSTSFCMAVGGTVNPDQTYIQQWDGRQWFAEQGSNPIEPDVPANNDALVTVSCVSVLYCAASGT
ncbi:MAG TPA: Ig domain-containing protein, partial [Acidimicrobiales bacterium]|nr:Ig domain-containing protein [Acidimicrobiales bacterium]